MEFQIEKGIPLPGTPGRGRRSKYPLDAMKKGDSFFVQKNGEDLGKLQTSLAGSCQYKSKKTGRCFTTRQVKDNGKEGVRVWRVK